MLTMESFYKDLGALIKEARENKQLLQAEIAQKIGLSRASIINIEAGRHRPLLHHVLDLAFLLDISFEKIITLYSQHKFSAEKEKQPSNIKKIINDIYAKKGD